MVTANEVSEQLKRIGASFRTFGRAEVKELPNILMPGERIVHCLNGWHQGAIALLCATDQRLLIVDKRPLFLNLEDLRYDMIIEVDYAARMLDSSIILHTTTKQLRFQSMNHHKLRATRNHLQERILMARQQLQAMPQTSAATTLNTVSPMFWRRRPAKFNLR